MRAIQAHLSVLVVFVVNDVEPAARASRRDLPRECGLASVRGARRKRKVASSKRITVVEGDLEGMR